MYNFHCTIWLVFHDVLYTIQICNLTIHFKSYACSFDYDIHTDKVEEYNHQVLFIRAFCSFLQ